MEAELADRLFDHALLRGRFVLRSGAESDRYFDKYRVTTNPQLLEPVARELDALRRQVAADAALIVAPELGAVPLATALSLVSGLPFVIVRGAQKDYGTGHRIEGPFEAGTRAVLVEDVVTSGGAAAEALAAARDAGIEIDAALCVLDRGQGGAQALAGCGATLHPLLHAGDLERAFDRGRGLAQAAATS